jgi:hypothetical protein
MSAMMQEEHGDAADALLYLILGLVGDEIGQQSVHNIRVCEMLWDDDIAGLDLPDTEKDGLQVHRNYSRTINDLREKQFASEVDAQWPDTSTLGEALMLIHEEAIKFVPVVACAFADEELAAMFKTFLPDGMPGGKKAMLGRFGPLSTLYNRIQFAFAFDMVNSDLLIVLDKLRDQRNKISHTWNARLLDDFFKDTAVLNLAGLDDAIQASGMTELVANSAAHPEEILRIRTIWLLTRLFYETRLYPLAKKARVDPMSALYGKNHPKLLGKISTYALTISTITAPNPVISRDESGTPY